MADGSIARRYAKALVALGQEEGGITDALTQELEAAVAALQANNGQLLEALCHPALSPSERKAVLDAVLPKLNIQPLLQNFLKLLLDKQRFAHLPAIAADARRQADELAGRARAVVTTASKLTAAMEKEVKATLEKATGKEILLEAHIDPSLIGGMVAQVGGKVFDASVKTRLSELRQQLLDSNPSTPVGDA
jgi:F-type H+-transporting ATPase subunit delta